MDTADDDYEDQLDEQPPPRAPFVPQGVGLTIKERNDRAAQEVREAYERAKRRGGPSPEEAEAIRRTQWEQHFAGLPSREEILAKMEAAEQAEESELLEELQGTAPEAQAQECWNPYWGGPDPKYADRQRWETMDDHSRRLSRERAYERRWDQAIGYVVAEDLRYALKYRRDLDRGQELVKAFTAFHRERQKPDVISERSWRHSGYYYTDLASVRWLYKTPEWLEYQEALRSTREDRKKPRDRALEKKHYRARTWLLKNHEAIITGKKSKVEVDKRLKVLGLTWEQWLHECKNAKS